MATDKTLSELTQLVVSRLSMVDGTDVQLYAEDRIEEELQHTFDFVFESAYWPQFSTWQSAALNGTTGEVTATLTSILKRWEDLFGVWYEDNQRPIPVLPNNYNPYGLSGTRPIFIEPFNDNSKIFRVWPVAATGDVRFYVRTKPAEFGSADTVNFDSEALILGATYGILEDDGDNPGATEKFHRKFESRMKQLYKSAFHQHPLPLNPNMASAVVPNEWYEAP